MVAYVEFILYKSLELMYPRQFLSMIQWNALLLIDATELMPINQ
jgi:hypothetical protein